MVQITEERRHEIISERAQDVNETADEILRFLAKKKFALTEELGVLELVKMGIVYEHYKKTDDIVEAMKTDGKNER